MARGGNKTEEFSFSTHLATLDLNFIINFLSSFISLIVYGGDLFQKLNDFRNELLVILICKVSQSFVLV